MTPPQTVRDVLTPIQRRVWDTVAASLLETGSPPTLRVINEQLGLNSKQSAAYVINALIAKGFLDKNWIVPGLAVAVRPAAAKHIDQFRYAGGAS